MSESFYQLIAECRALLRRMGVTAAELAETENYGEPAENTGSERTTNDSISPRTGSACLGGSLKYWSCGFRYLLQKDI